MKNVLTTIFLLAAMTARGADYKVIADSQHPADTTPIDNLYEGESGTIEIEFRNDGVVRTVASDETVSLWYGTNSLKSLSIMDMSITGTNVITFATTNFPQSTPRTRPYTFGVGIGDKVYGTGITANGHRQPHEPLDDGLLVGQPRTFWIPDRLLHPDRRGRCGGWRADECGSVRGCGRGGGAV
jgi:hypothetical protein